MPSILLSSAEHVFCLSGEGKNIRLGTTIYWAWEPAVVRFNGCYGSLMEGSHERRMQVWEDFTLEVAFRVSKVE